MKELIKQRRSSLYISYRKTMPEFTDACRKSIRNIDKQLAKQGTVIVWSLADIYDWNYDLESCPENTEVWIIGFWDRLLRKAVKKNGEFKGKQYGEYKALCWRHIGTLGKPNSKSATNKEDCRITKV